MKTNDKTAQMRDNTLHGRGFKIRTLSGVFAVIGLILLVYVGYNLHAVVGNYKNLVDIFNIHMNSHKYITELQSASDDMTKESRLFVITRDSEHMLKYLEIVNNSVREKACAQLDESLQTIGCIQSIESLKEAIDESNSLMDAEIHAMKIVTQITDMDENIISDIIKNYQLSEDEDNLSKTEKMDNAYDLVLGDEYCKEKSLIDLKVQIAVNSMSEKLESDTNVGIDNMWSVINSMVVLCFLLAILFIIIFIFIAILVIRPLRIYVKCVKENRLFDLVGAYEFKYLALTYNNIFEVNQENKEQMKFKLAHDTLTGACSRLAFEEQKKILSKTNIPLALLMIDVDRFKQVNDTYGHEIGDQALIKVSNSIRSILRDDDILARIGGDEFAVVLMNVYEYSSKFIGEKIDIINNTLQNPRDGMPKLSLSIGITFSEDGYSEELFKQADSALYETKKNGKCGYTIYTEVK